jgi:3-oxoacyl-[acyl-carrier protein] reductase
MSIDVEKVVVVTGGTGGIGTEINRRLARDGYIVMAADTSVNPADNGKPWEDLAESVFVHHIDVRDGGSVNACVAAAARLGQLHGVVNCAGILRHGLVEDISEESLSAVWDVNLAGMARVCRAARPHLQKGASIVNITSVTAWLGRLRGASLYGASKAAMEAFTRYLAYELAPHGIRANALAPGFIEVLPMSESMRFIAHSDTDQGAIDWLLPHIPLGRMGKPDEMAGPVAFLLSEDASYITGHVLLADGGVVAA